MKHNHTRFLCGFFLGSAISAAGALLMAPHGEKIKERSSRGTLTKNKTKKTLKAVSSLIGEKKSEKKNVQKRHRKPVTSPKMAEKKQRVHVAKDTSK